MSESQYAFKSDLDHVQAICDYIEETLKDVQADISALESRISKLEASK